MQTLFVVQNYVPGLQQFPELFARQVEELHQLELKLIEVELAKRFLNECSATTPSVEHKRRQLRAVIAEFEKCGDMNKQVAALGKKFQEEMNAMLVKREQIARDALITQMIGKGELLTVDLEITQGYPGTSAADPYDSPSTHSEQRIYFYEGQYFRLDLKSDTGKLLQAHSQEGLNRQEYEAYCTRHGIEPVSRNVTRMLYPNLQNFNDRQLALAQADHQFRSATTAV